MPKYTIEAPDGRKLTVEADDEGSAISGVQQWVQQNPKASPDVGTDIAKGVGYGFNEGFDATLNMIGAPIRAPINYISEQLGYGEAIPELQAARRFNVAGPAETTAGRTAQTVGEVAGASALPTGGLLKAGQSAGKLAPAILTQYGQAPATAAGIDALSAAGAGLGVSFARENELGPTGELAAGLVGGFAAPNIANIAARGYGAVEGAGKYAGRMIDRARNPQMAADQDTVDALLKAGVTPDDLYREFAPTPSAALQGRNIDEAAMVDMLSRSAAGEAVDQIAKDYGIAPKTLQKYLREHKQANPTPRNIADVVQDLTDVGAAEPVIRLGRAAHGIADDAQTISALTKRQNDQYGRVVGVINRAAKNRNYDEVVDEIDQALTTKSKQAYGLAHQNEQPFDLWGPIRQFRDEAFRSAGKIKTGLEEAIDLFFMPVMGPDGKVARLGEPISDVPRYQAAREALDQMIQTSKFEGKATPLTRKLTQFRRSVNKTVRDSNPLLAAADDQFSGAKTTEALLKRGEELTTRLGSKADEFFKDYKTLTPEQKELVRIGFLRKLSNQAATPREGAAVANQFQSQAVKQIVKRLFSPDPAAKNMTAAQKKDLTARNKEIVRARNELLTGLRREATTTNTLNRITNRGNTQTAPWARDMDKMAEGAELVGDAVTLNWMGVLRKTGKKLANQIGEEQAGNILRNLTQTEPYQVLPTLQRLAKAAKTKGERDAYVLGIREFAKVGRRPAVDAGTISATTGE